MHRFFFLLHRAQRALRSRMERETRGALGLTSLELTALWALRAKPRLGVQALARVLYVDHAVASRLSKQLVRKGVARRVPNPNDKRSTQLELEELGVVKARDGKRILRAANARITEGFSDEELAIVARFLEHLIAFGEESDPT